MLFNISMLIAPGPRSQPLKHKHRNISAERMHMAPELWSQRDFQRSLTNIPPGVTKDIEPHRLNWLSLETAS